MFQSTTRSWAEAAAVAVEEATARPGEATTPADEVKPATTPLSNLQVLSDS